MTAKNRISQAVVEENGTEAPGRPVFAIQRTLAVPESWRDGTGWRDGARYVMRVGGEGEGFNFELVEE